MNKGGRWKGQASATTLLHSQWLMLFTAVPKSQHCGKNLASVGRRYLQSEAAIHHYEICSHILCIAGKCPRGTKIYKHWLTQQRVGQ